MSALRVNSGTAKKTLAAASRMVFRGGKYGARIGRLSDKPVAPLVSAHLPWCLAWCARWNSANGN